MKRFDNKNTTNIWRIGILVLLYGIMIILKRNDDTENIMQGNDTQIFIESENANLGTNCLENGAFQQEELSNDIQKINISEVCRDIRVLLVNDKGSYYWNAEEIINDNSLKNYPGQIEIINQDKGYLVIDCVPLEEYLYYVVGSEMPSSFGIEALKAQAVCARTYAIRNMIKGNLSEYYADVDNTCNYQVFSPDNINDVIVKAVDETKGEFLTYENEPIEAFYYSCSSGHGATGNAFGIISEENLYEYLVAKDYGDLEENCSWYQWNIYVPLNNKDIIYNKLQNKIMVSNKIEVYDHNNNVEADKTIVSNYLDTIPKIQDIQVENYCDGYLADKLLIDTEKYIYVIYGENAIRYILGNTNYNVICHDYSTHQMDMLPSGFFEIECNYNIGVNGEKEVSGYQINGGGFGHGVGMSQYGACYLAEQGFSYKDILTYYYQGVSLNLLE